MKRIKENLPCAQDVYTCKDGSYVGRTEPTCNFLKCPETKIRRFTGQLYYRLTDKKSFEKPLEFVGLSDGKFQEYKINLPTIDEARIEEIRFVVTSGVKINETIVIDWIRVSGAAVKESPTPEKVPKPPTEGCYEKSVFCIKAPCPKIMVCPQ